MTDHVWRWYSGGAVLAILWGLHTTLTDLASLKRAVTFMLVVAALLIIPYSVGYAIEKSKQRWWA